MKYDGKVERKNPIFWALVCVVIGGVTAATGWIWWDAITPWKADASIWLLLPGVVVLLLGLYIWFFGYTKKPTNRDY